MKFDTKKPLYVMIYAAVVSALFTAAIMTLHASTQHIVERNERLARMSALVSVFELADQPNPSDARIEELFNTHIRRVEGDLVDPQTGVNFNHPQDPRLRTYKAYDADPAAGGKLLGYAFPVWGVGFWARIDGLLAVTPEVDKTLGVEFLSHQETPGLGGRITEEKFTEQWEGLNVSPPEQAGQILYITKSSPEGGDPAYGRHVDAITGATGTSHAVEAFVNTRIEQFRRAAQAKGLLTDAAGEAPHAEGGE
jgi:Na+-transporting NADH:ubiquinone oxidoreductase subunit C